MAAAGLAEPCDATSTADLADRLAAARAMLRSAWPDAVEREAPRGAGRTFVLLRPGTNMAVLRLVVDPPNLLLHFAEGARLPDPAGLLRGTGLRGRYVCLGAVKPEDRPALVALVAAATTDR